MLPLPSKFSCQKARLQLQSDCLHLGDQGGHVGEGAGFRPLQQLQAGAQQRLQHSCRHHPALGSRQHLPQQLIPAHCMLLSRFDLVIVMRIEQKLHMHSTVRAAAMLQSPAGLPSSIIA